MVKNSITYAAGANKFGGYTPTLLDSIFVQYEYYFLYPRLYISYANGEFLYNYMKDHL